MKVTLLTATNSRYAGGLFYSVKNLAISLLKTQECDVNILSYNDEYSQEDISTYGDVPMPTYNILNLYFLKKLSVSKNINKILKSLQPDIIHQQSIWKYYSFASLRYKKNNPSVKTIIAPRGALDIWAIKHHSLIKSVARFLYENKNLKTADCLHALCQSEYESFRTLGLKNPIAIIPNGTTIPDWKREYIEKDKKTILFLSRINPKKGVEELITAIHLIEQRNPAVLNNWIFQISGWNQGECLEELQSLVQKYNLDSIVKFTGALYGAEKEKTLKTVDAFILPSHSEGMPMAVLEAWSYGLPVIMTDFCNIPDGFSTNSAFRIDIKPELMSEQLEVFLNFSQPEIAKMGNNGYDLVKQNYSWEVVAEKTVMLYNWLLEKGEKPEFVYDINSLF